MERPIRKLGVNCDSIRGMHPTETLKLMQEVGFEAYFTGAYTRAAVAPIKKAGDALGLTLNSLHAPFGGINDLWMPGMGYRAVYKQILETIDAAAENGIPAIVLHVSSGWNAPEITDLGLSRYDALVEYAEDRGVQIAFENLRMLGNLACLTDRYKKVPHVMYCLDIGHQHCYTPTINWMDIFRDRLLLTHIHDNFGIQREYQEDTDTHYLPFDGDVDYAQMMRDLDKYGYTGNLTLEIFNTTRPEYSEMTPEAFLKTAYERLVRISKM
jgi:sugar phosphate isomerase/epimerase